MVVTKSILIDSSDRISYIEHFHPGNKKGLDN